MLDYREHELDNDSDDWFSLSIWFILFSRPTDTIIGSKTCIMIEKDGKLDNYFGTCLVIVEMCVAHVNLHTFGQGNFLLCTESSSLSTEI